MRLVMFTSDRLMLVSIPKGEMRRRDLGFRDLPLEEDRVDAKKEFLETMICNLPTGFVVEHGPDFDLQTMNTQFIISHESFSVVPDGNVITEFPAEFRQESPPDKHSTKKQSWARLVNQAIRKHLDEPTIQQKLKDRMALTFKDRDLVSEIEEQFSKPEESPEPEPEPEPKPINFREWF
jgi:hypothetical protein